MEDKHKAAPHPETDVHFFSDSSVQVSQLHSQHNKFKKELMLSGEFNLKEAEALLEKITQAGEFVSDFEQRDLLTNIARDIGEIIFEKTNIYPITRLKLLSSHSFIQNGSEVTIPFQIPARAEHFTDRAEALAQLLTDLQPGRVVTLCGPGGIGKSALAAQALNQLELDRFPDGIIWHNFYNQPQADLALENIARAFGEEPKPTPRDAALRVLANKRVLLFLDGTEDADNLGAVLAVRGSHCGVLVTSRKSDDAPNEWQDIRPLETAQAVELLQAWGKQYATDLPAASEICKLVGGLPLAIRFVGRYLARKKQPAPKYLLWLQAQPLRALDQGQRREQSVPLLLERSLQQVSEIAQQALAMIGLLALSPFDSAVVAAAFDLPLFEAENLLGELVSYGLLSPNDSPPTPYSLLPTPALYQVTHALIHTYARAQLTPPPEVTARVAEYYTALAETESANGLPGYRRLDTERAHLLRVLTGCHERGEWDAVQRLVWAVGTHDGYLIMQGHMTERHTLLETGLAAARQGGNQYNEAAFLDMLATNHRSMGRVTAAITLYEQALVIDKARGDKQGQGVFLGNLGNAYSNLGQVDKAIEFYQQALLISREIGDRRGEGNRLGNLGVAYHDLGQVDKAIEFYQQALLISREIGNRQGEGNSVGNLGNAYSNLGQVEQAIEFYQQALLIAREIGDRRNEGAWLGNLGLAYSNLGQLDKAIEFYQQALLISREIGDRRGEGVHLGGLSGAYRELGQFEQAIIMAEQGLRIAREIGAVSSEGYRYQELGLAYRDLGQIDTARSYLQQSVTIFEAIKSPETAKSRRLLQELDTPPPQLA